VPRPCSSAESSSFLISGCLIAHLVLLPTEYLILGVEPHGAAHNRPTRQTDLHPPLFRNQTTLSPYSPKPLSPNSLSSLPVRLHLNLILLLAFAFPSLTNSRHCSSHPLPVCRPFLFLSLFYSPNPAIMMLFPGVMAPTYLIPAPVAIYCPAPAAPPEKKEEKKSDPPKPDPPKPDPPKPQCKPKCDHSHLHQHGPHIQINYGHRVHASSTCGMYSCLVGTVTSFESRS